MNDKNENAEEPGFDLEEVSSRHINKIDKFFRMFAGAASSLASYESGIIGIEVRLGENLRFSDPDMARKLADSWRHEPELENATGFVAHLYRTSRPVGFAVRADAQPETDLVKILAAKLGGLARDYPDVLVGTVTGTFLEGDDPTYASMNHTNITKTGRDKMNENEENNVDEIGESQNPTEKKENIAAAASTPSAEGGDLSFRPPTYWEDGDPLAAILRNVKGTNRRQMIRDFWEAGKLEELEPENLADEPDPKFKKFLESLHPSFMGGEYLPDFLPTEVEIARIELQSTTADVISIRARKEAGDKLFHYRVVDEYEEQFEIAPKSSSEPLTLGELVGLIDTCNAGEGGGLALIYNGYNLDGGADAESLRHFTTVTSEFYPGLFDHYDQVHQRWVEEVNVEAGGEEE